jgi:hypothetical protein
MVSADQSLTVQNGAGGRVVDRAPPYQAAGRVDEVD